MYRGPTFKSALQPGSLRCLVYYNKRFCHPLDMTTMLPCQNDMVNQTSYEFQKSNIAFMCKSHENFANSLLIVFVIISIWSDSGVKKVTVFEFNAMNDTDTFSFNRIAFHTKLDILTFGKSLYQTLSALCKPKQWIRTKRLATGVYRIFTKWINYSWNIRSSLFDFEKCVYNS